MYKIKIKLSFTSLFAFLLVLLCMLFSCKKEQDEVKSIGYLEFVIDPDYSNSLKSNNANEQLTSVVISIDKADGTSVLSLKKISIQKVNDIYIVEPIAIETGTYKLTYFAVLDVSDQLRYLSPLSGSTLAAYVKKPLSIEFSVLKDETITLTPEVLSTNGALPGDFGLTSFKFNIVKTINIFPYAFNSSTSSVELTDATLTVSDGTTDFMTKTLSAKGNIIELPEKENYIFKIQKNNYLTYQCSFSKAEIESNVSPLIVILQSELPGIVAYYPFEGNLNDISGYGRNGTYSGLSNFVIGNFGKARNFSTKTSPHDYIEVPNSINPTSFTISCWLNFDSINGHHTLLFLSNGDQWAFSNLMIATTSNRLSIIFDTLDLRTLDYSHDALVAGKFNTTFLNSKQLEKNINYHVCFTFSGSTVSVYIDGVLDAAYTSVNRVHETVSNPIIIGACPVEFTPGSYYYPLNGKIDEFKVYSRALTSSEISSLYNSYIGTTNTASGLVAYYPLNANANDITGNGNNGVVYGATPTTDRFGNSNSAYSFNGTSNYIALPSANLQNSQYSISLWVLAATLPPSGDRTSVIDIGSANGDQFINLVNNYSGAELYNGWCSGGYNISESQFATNGITNVVLNQWYHITITRNLKTMALYINGNLVDVETNGIESLPNYGDGPVLALIGKRNNNTLFFNGKVDDVLIYNRAISADEVKYIYKMQ